MTQTEQHRAHVLTRVQHGRLAAPDAARLLTGGRIHSSTLPSSHSSCRLADLLTSVRFCRILTLAARLASSGGAPSYLLWYGRLPTRSELAGLTEELKGHVIEQQSDNRLIRPESEFTGPTNLTYIPIDER